MHKRDIQEGHDSKANFLRGQEGLKHLVDDWLSPELGVDVAALWDAGQWIPPESLGFEQLSQDESPQLL